MNKKLCIKCNKKIARYENAITCAVSCEGSYHISCVQISLETFQELKDSGEISSWKCDNCEASSENDSDELLNTSVVANDGNGIKEFVIDILKTVKEIKAENKLLRDELNDLKTFIVAKWGENSVKNVGNYTQTYAESAKNNRNVLLVKPKTNQGSDITKSEVKSKIRPADMAIGVSMVKEVKRGGIIIEYDNLESKEKCKHTLTKELGKKYEIREPKLMNPKLIIVGIDQDDLHSNDEDLVHSIIEQNAIIHEKASLKVIARKKHRNNNAMKLVIESDSDSFKSLMSKGVLNIGWRRCPVFEFIDVHRCFNCNLFGHYAKECTNKMSCGNCNGEHKLSACDNAKRECANCNYAAKKFHLKINVNHSIFDKKCPSYIKQLDMQKRKINYNS